MYEASKTTYSFENEPIPAGFEPFSDTPKAAIQAAAMINSGRRAGVSDEGIYVKASWATQNLRNKFPGREDILQDTANLDKVVRSLYDKKSKGFTI